jgi:hypothetical protein
MIQVDSLLYKIDQRLNKLSSNSHQRIQLEDKILSLNEAQIKLIKQKIDGISIVSRLGADSFKKRYDDLQILVENYKDHPLTLAETNDTLNQWSASIEGLTPKYMFYVDSYFLATKGKCKDRIIWVNVELSKHGDTQFLLNNDHYKPSFEYQETFSSISTNKISIFTDGSFLPSKLYLMYIRYPQIINKSGYVMLDGEDSTDSNCELASYLEDEILDLAVQNLAMYTENSSAVQSAQFRIQTNE